MEHKIFKMSFAKVYPMYVQKAERKDRTKKEVDIQTFFKEAPKFNRKATLITGVVCGVRVEDIKDPLMKKIRYLDKLIDELAKGKEMEQILRSK